MADARPQPKGRLRRWLDRRREAQRRGAEIGERAKSVRKADADRRARRGGADSGGPFIGGI